MDSNNIVVPPPSTGVLFNSNGVLRANPNFVFDWSNTNVGIGTLTPKSRLSVFGSGSIPVMIATNTSGAYVAMYLSGSGGNLAAFQITSTGSQGAYQTTDGFLESAFSFNTRSNAADRRYVRWNNRDNRFFVQSLSDALALQNIPLIITNNAAQNSLVIHSNGVVEFGAADPGGAITFRLDPTMRQFTVATNAVRVFGISGITVSPSNNTANGSIDYRASISTNQTDFALSGTLLYATSVWTASSDGTNFVISPPFSERWLNMTNNVRVVGISQLAPSGFRGFLGVSLTNNSGSTYTLTATNTFLALGTNSFSVASGKALRVVFQIDENRVSYGGKVQD